MSPRDQPRVEVWRSPDGWYHARVCHRGRVVEVSATSKALARQGALAAAERLAREAAEAS